MADPAERIVAAACQRDGLVFSKAAPARHHNVLWAMSHLGGGDGHGFAIRCKPLMFKAFSAKRDGKWRRNIR